MTTKLASLKGLYAIVDVDFASARGVDLWAFTEAVLEARPALLQLRAKSLGAAETLAALRQLQSLCSKYGVPLFANDRPDLALLAGCAGVHVGQTDLPIADARRLAPELGVGVSTHGLEELERALEQRPTYVAFGPVFTTSSKRNPEPVVGLEALAAAAARCRAAGVPLVAIGGIDVARAALVARAADMGAVISALLPPGGLAGVREVAARLHASLGGAAARAAD